MLLSIIQHHAKALQTTTLHSNVQTSGACRTTAMVITPCHCPRGSQLQTFGCIKQSKRLASCICSHFQINSFLIVCGVPFFRWTRRLPSDDWTRCLFWQEKKVLHVVSTWFASIELAWLSSQRYTDVSRLLDSLIACSSHRKKLNGRIASRQPLSLVCVDIYPARGRSIRLIALLHAYCMNWRAWSV